MKRLLALLLSLGMILSAMAGCGGSGEPGDPADPVEPSTVEDGEPAMTQPPEDTPKAPGEPAEEAVNHEWAVAAPESFGVDSAVFAEIHRKLAGSQMLAVVTVKDGVIVDEFYQEGYDADSIFPVHSVTKSVMGSLIGIAIEQGLLEGVEVKLEAFFPQLADADDARKREVTIEHLLLHTSGLGLGDTGDSFRALVESENWVDYFLSLPVTAEPGTAFHYTTAGSHMLSAVLEQATGVSTHDYALEHLFGPIGLESAVWDTDPQGITDGGNGLHLSARDAARFGQLYLDGGRWRGRQVVPRDWVEVSTSEHAVGEPDKGAYGYQFWIKSFGAGGAYNGYYALGYAGQFVFVVPELGLVTAITSRTIWSDYTAQAYLNEVIAAFTA